MIELSRFFTIDRQSAQPVYLQIAQGIITMIKEGVLPPGIKIQPTRYLSTQLHVNRNTVVAAYNELHAQGWIAINPRKGCYISHNLPHLYPIPLLADKPQISSYPQQTTFTIGHELFEELKPQYPSFKSKYTFNEGFPDIRLAPLKELLREYNSLGNSKKVRKYLSYSAKEGSHRLREELVKMLRQTRGLCIGTENILITKGAQMAIYMAASLLIKPGDNVIVGEPNYFVVNAMLKRLGANICQVPVDDDGIDIEVIEALCQTKSIRMIYVIPHHHHPTTVTLSAERRLKLLDIAAKHKIAIIEDDFDFDIHYENRPTLPMASYDNYGNIIYIGTLTKTLAPAIRLGFIVAPQNFIGLLAQHRFMIDLQGDNLLEEAMAEMFSNGTMDRHLKKIRILYKQRRDLICNMLAEHLHGTAFFKVPQGGLCVWVKFEGADTRIISQQAARLGLFIKDGKNHNSAQKDYNSMCIGFASMNLHELEQAVKLLIEAVILSKG